MVHFRQESAIETYFEKNNGSPIIHTYNKVTKEITRDNYKDLDPKFLQSLSTRLKQNGGSSKKTSVVDKGTDGSGSQGTNSVGDDKTKNQNITQAEFIRKELIRLSTSTFMVEEKLDYPKVFKALITEPHTALDYMKKHEEYEIRSFFYVDTSVGYNINDNGFHHTMIEVGSKIKGINMFATSQCYLRKSKNESTEVSHLEHMINSCKKGDKIFIFTQGCGHVSAESLKLLKFIKNVNITFSTSFSKGCDCGCSIINAHERLQKLAPKNIRINYDIDSYKKLQLIKSF